MEKALVLTIGILFDLYVFTFLLRIAMQWIRADFRNPLTQFIVRVTNPLVIPLRRIVPAAGNLDTASLIVVLLLQLIFTVVVLGRYCGEPNFLQVLSLTVLRTVYLIVRMYMFVILAYVILSWINPGTYNPVAALLAALAEPALRPFRRLIPPIGGLDLSALFTLVGIYAVSILLREIAAGISCGTFVQLM